MTLGADLPRTMVSGCNVYCLWVTYQVSWESEPCRSECDDRASSAKERVIRRRSLTSSVNLAEDVKWRVNSLL
jgi:hypothetical protein